MPETLPRPLVALTVIVVIIATTVGVKDYLNQRKEAKSAAVATPAVVADSSSKARSKKTTSAKSKRARRLVSKANIPAVAESAGDEAAKPVIGQEFPEADAVRAQADPDQDPAASATDSVARKRAGFNTIAFPLSSTCLPLPNVTKPGDVDAQYYENWAKEYCGL